MREKHILIVPITSCGQLDTKRSDNWFRFSVALCDDEGMILRLTFDS